MSTLQKLQQSLQGHLMFSDKSIAEYITAADEKMAATRLGVYHHAYKYRLLDVLQIDYAVLYQLLGDDVFSEIGFAYIDTHPSRHFSVNQFGKYMENFLATTAPYNEQPYLSELASFVWTLNWAVDAVDAPVLTTQDIAVIPQEQWADMHLKLHPTLKLHTAHWNVLPIWQALIQNQPPEAPVQQSVPVYCVIWRKGIQPYYCPLNEQEAWVIQALQQNQSFGEICDGLTQWYPEEEVAAYAVNLLLRWLNDEMLTEVTVAS